MFTTEELSKELNGLRNGLVTDITVARDRARKGRETASKKSEYEAKIETLTNIKTRYKAAGNHILNMFKNIQHYAQLHQEQSKAVLDLAIEEAGALVPDAESAGVYLKHTDDNRVILVDSEGFNVNIKEGGGYRTSLGLMLRYATLSVQPDAFPLLLLDEYFFAMSDETLSAIHPRLEEIKKKVAIICIEQRRCAMAGIVDNEYSFKKGADKNTVVTKVT